MRKRYQWVWWGWDDPVWPWSFRRWREAMAKIYEWSLWIGPLEIRKWREARDEC